MRLVSRFKIYNKNDAAAEANENAQTNFYNTLTSNYSQDFGDFENVEQGLLSKLQPIVNAGPGQYGFDQTEDTAMRGADIDSDAAAAQSAQQATQRQITAANGGADLMPTGAADELREEGDVNAAQKLSSDMNSITQAGYQAGQQNYENALSGEESVMGMMNPNSFASAATSGGSSATSAVNADTNAQEASDSWMTMVGGALGGVSGALTSRTLPKPPKPAG